MRFSIYECSIEIICNNNIYKDYLQKEFSLMEDSCADCRSDIQIYIVNERYRLSKRATRLSENFWITKDVLIQKFKAFNRSFWIVYYNPMVIYIYIPYKGGDPMGKFLSPFYESRVEGCVSDFFHNTFLAILQIQLLKNGGSLFHCSGFSYKNRNILLTGEGQSGKSAILSVILKKYSEVYLAEDFAVLYLDGTLCGYPHQTRLKVDNLERKKLDNMSFLEKVNVAIYRRLYNGNNARHYAVKELFPEASYERRVNVHLLLFLRRNVKIFKVDVCKLEEAILMENTIIKTEFQNMVYCEELVENLKKLGYIEYDFKGFLKKTYDLYKIALSKFTCFVVKLPYYDNINEAAEKLIKLVEEN